MTQGHAKKFTYGPLAAIAVFTLANPAFGQIDPTLKSQKGAAGTPEVSAGLGDIVVTARKTEERLQDVPVAVTVFAGTELEDRNITNFNEVSAFTPGFATRQSPTSPTGILLALRGQVQNDVLATLDPSVGTYVDGVYWARAQGLNSDMVDVKAVQVLKGPQGTLFGRNTTGGAFLIQTNDPNTDSFSGLFQAGYGRFNERTGTAVVNLPLGSSVAVRGAIQARKRDGYVRDRVTGAKSNDIDNLVGRAKLLVKPTDTLSIIASGEWFSWDQDTSRFLTLALPGPTGLGIGGLYPGTVAEIAKNLAEVDTVDNSGMRLFFPNNPALGFDYPDAKVPFSKARTQTYNVIFSLDTSFGEIKWINSYRKVRTDALLSFGGSAFPISAPTLKQDLSQKSSELQLTGTFLDGRIDLATGMTYLHEEGYDRSLSFATNAGNRTGLVVSRFQGIIDNDSLGAYAQANFHVDDRLTFTGGLRYSIDDKGIITNTGAISSATGQLLSCLVPSTRTVANDCRDQRDDTFKALSYTIGADYKLAEDILVYAKQSRGYRSGGQQLRSASPADSAPFQPEIVNEQEIGLKTQFFDRRVRFNMAAYHNTISNAQRSQITRVAGVLQTIVENANVRNLGVEVELLALVAPGLTFSANASHNDPKYTKYLGVVGASAGVDKAALGIRFDGLIKSQFSVAADYIADLSIGELRLNVNYVWAGKEPTSPESLGTLALLGNKAVDAERAVDLTTKRAAGFLGARATLGFGENFDVAVWARNILDNRPIVHTNFSTDYGTSIRAEPATYGVTGTFKF